MASEKIQASEKSLCNSDENQDEDGFRRPQIVLHPPSPPEVLTMVSQTKEDHVVQRHLLRVPPVPKHQHYQQPRKEDQRLRRNKGAAMATSKVKSHRTAKILKEIPSNLTTDGKKHSETRHVTEVYSETHDQRKGNPADKRKRDRNRKPRNEAWHDDAAETTNHLMERSSGVQNYFTVKTDMEKTEQSSGTKQKVQILIKQDSIDTNENTQDSLSTVTKADEDEESSPTEPDTKRAQRERRFSKGQVPENLTGGPLECWTAFNKLSERGCRVSLTTLHRALLTPTEIRLMEESSRFRKS